MATAMGRIGLADDDQQHIPLLRSFLSRYEEEAGIKIQVQALSNDMNFIEDHDGKLDIVFFDNARKVY